MLSEHKISTASSLRRERTAHVQGVKCSNYTRVTSESNWSEITAAAPRILVCCWSDYFPVHVCIVSKMDVFPTKPD